MTPTTILVLDSQPNSPIRKMLDGEDQLAVVTPSLKLAQHALTSMIISVWICDMTYEMADISALVSIAEYASQNIRIIFVGPPATKLKADKLLEKGHGVTFVNRPVTLEFKKLIKAQVDEFIQSTPSRMQGTYTGETVNLYFQQMANKDQLSVFVPNSDQYSLIDTLGTGGTGTVFLARDRFLGIDVAIKVVNAQILSDAETLKSFKDEARIAMQLSHRNIVRLYNFSSDQGCYYIVMEMVHGKTLRDVILEQRALSVVTTCQIMAACADALEYAHENNVIHNDLKPENIFITDGGEVKIIDFGTASLKNRAKDLSHIVGTPEYISPEQLRCEISGPATDVYSMGILTYLMFTGSFPFPSETTVDALLSGMRPNFSALPEPLAKVLAKASAYESEFRYQSMGEYVHDLIEVCGCQDVCKDIHQPIEIKSAFASTTIP